MRGRYYVAGAIAAFAVAIGLMLGPQGREALAQTAFRLFNGTTMENHMLVTGSAPTVTNGTLAPGSTDMAGVINTTSSVSSVLTFATTWAVAPFCVATDNKTNEAVRAQTTTTTLTVAGGTNGDPLAYLCLGTVNN